MKATVILAVATLALAGCGDRFGGDGGGAGAGGGFGAGSLGSVDDPTSPAYFNEIVGDRVLFEVDQSTLTAEARVTLDSQARWLLDNQAFSAVIEGHADERGTTEYNLALGARRASAVQEYLFAQGISLNRLETVTYGKERPIALCSDESCWSQNRRAVTVLKAGPGV